MIAKKICVPCNRKRYTEEQLKKMEGHVYSCYTAKCDFCGETTSIFTI